MARSSDHHFIARRLPVMLCHSLADGMDAEIVLDGVDVLVLRREQHRVIRVRGAPDHAGECERNRAEREQHGVGQPLGAGEKTQRAHAGDVQRHEHVGEFAPGAARVAHVLDQSL
jgi:hypothetical protein